MDSVWMENVSLPRFEALRGNADTDVLIIGGGITGLLCAYFLKEAGVDYILAERTGICAGVTKNTTAKITSQHGLIYADLVRKQGIEKAALYLEANQKALSMYRALSSEIDCDFEEKSSYVYSLDDSRKLEEEVEALQRLHFPAELVQTEELPFPTAGAVAFPEQAQFHPLKFLAGIAKDLNIYEHTFVKELSEHEAVTANGRIFFKRLIFATHFPIDNKHGLYFLKMYQQRSYCIALKNAAQIKGMYVDGSGKGLSFRNYGDFLLLGGGGHRTGKKGGNWQELRETAKKYYPEASEAYAWAAQDCMTLDGIPYIGKYSPAMPACFAATGYNKWGMTSAMTAAMLLADLIMEKENPFTAVFDPSRSMLKPQLFYNAAEAAAGLLSLTTRRCPHLGCALKWNEAEHSWDCSCHGSRFDEEGALLDNPANGDLCKEKAKR